MTKGITEKEPDPEIVYADIFHHTHHQSKTHPHMSLYDRAAQFAPFAALTGYDDMVAEEARYVEAQTVLEDAELELLNQKLNLLSDVLDDGVIPTVSITYFVPDENKSGGKYVTKTESIKRIDAAGKQIFLTRREGTAGSNAIIDFGKITAIHGEIVDHLDDTVL